MSNKISKWYFLIAILWMLIWVIVGIKSAEGQPPSADSNPMLDTIFILSIPIVLPWLYYNLYNRINQWLAFGTTPLLGLLMEWTLFRPAEVLNRSAPVQASIFFAFIWAVILIPPYFFTRIADRSVTHRLWVVGGVAALFAIQVVRAAVF